MVILKEREAILLKRKPDQTSEGLNQIFELINAKGDEEELRQIVDAENTASSQEQTGTAK